MPGIAFEAAGVAQTQQRHHSFKADHPIQHPQSHHPRASTAPANPPHRDQIPIARGTARPQLPAGSFPGGFRTTAPGASENVAAGPSSETLHKTGREGVPTGAPDERGAKGRHEVSGFTFDIAKALKRKGKRHSASVPSVP